MSNSRFDTRMRALEDATNITLDPRLPIVVRVDGKSFHSYYRHFDGHFSKEMQHAMNTAMLATMRHIGDIVFGYTNSDEITFVLMPHEQGYYNFSGRLTKLTSIIASYVTAYFNQDTGLDDLAVFDARAFSVQSADQLLDVLTWRQKSGQRNVVSTFAREFVKPSLMQGLSTAQLEQFLVDSGIGRPKRDGFYYGYFAEKKTPQLQARLAKGSIQEIATLYLGL